MLQYLDVSHNALQSGDLENWSLPALLRLDASSNALVRLPWAVLRGSPLLSELWLDSNSIRLGDTCAVNSSLAQLGLGGNGNLGGSSSAWDAICKLSCFSQLQSLSLRGSALWTTDFVHGPPPQCSLPSLQTLDLGRVGARQLFQTDWSVSPRLTSLRIDGNPWLQWGYAELEPGVQSNGTRLVVDAATQLVCPSWSLPTRPPTDLAVDPSFFSLQRCTCPPNHFWTFALRRCVTCPDRTLCHEKPEHASLVAVHAGRRLRPQQTR